MKLITPDWNAPSNIRAFTTTREGGVSGAPFDSFNLGLHVGDDTNDVLRNRQTLEIQAGLPNPPIWLNQTHSTDVIELGDQSFSNLPNCDGTVTIHKNVLCAVMTADCVPLFLTNQRGNRIGMIHAGWQGMANGIIEQGIKALNEEPEQIIVWAGPCISFAYFEIGEEVKEQLGGSECAYRPSEKQGKYFADLYQLAGERLKNIGVNNYGHSSYCSYADEALFFSHRRDQKTGRMASLIWMS